MDSRQRFEPGDTVWYWAGEPMKGTVQRSGMRGVVVRFDELGTMTLIRSELFPSRYDLIEDRISITRKRVLYFGDALRELENLQADEVS